MALELDTYWAAQGGEHVPALLERLGARVVLDVEDVPADADGVLSPDRLDQVPVGEGALPWAEILAFGGVGRTRRGGVRRVHG